MRKEEKGTCGSHLKKKRITNLKPTERAWEERIQRDGVFLIFFLSKFISQIYRNLTVRFRRDKHKKCSTGRGLNVGTRNTGFHQEFR